MKSRSRLSNDYAHNKSLSFDCCYGEEGKIEHFSFLKSELIKLDKMKQLETERKCGEIEGNR